MNSAFETRRSCVRITSVAAISLLVQSIAIATEIPTVDEWRLDLAHLAERLKQQHPNVFATMQRSDFESAISHLHDAIPGLKPHEITVEFMRLAAMVGDGHTQLHLPRATDGQGPPEPLQFHRLPMTFYQYSDGLFVRHVDRVHAELAGMRVLRIGSATADEALQVVAPLVHTTKIVRKGNISLARAVQPLVNDEPERNTSRIRDWAPWYLSIPEILHALQISDRLDSVELELLDREGELRVVSVEAVGLSDKIDWVTSNPSDVAVSPLYLRHPEKNFWVEYLEDEHVVYAKYNRVLSSKGNSIYRFRDELFELIDDRRVDKLVIDVRNNGGGNNTLNRILLREIIIRNEELNHRGTLFCIIGRQTFSAAMNFVNSLERWTNVIFVGEPTAGAPNHFGDAETIRLPNSGLTGSVSTRYWQDSRPRETRPWVAPDIPVQLSSEDYRNNHDPVLQAVLDWRR